MNYQDAARELKGALHMRTEPLGVAFLRDAASLPEKTRRPSQVLGKRVTICQGVTMARVYGWSMGLTPEDLICVSGMLAFGLALDPEVVVVYRNPAQLMRLIQGAAFGTGERVQGDFGGKIECSSYLIGPHKTGQVRVTIPGMGDRIFSITQDDELVVSFPTRLLEGILQGMAEAGKKIGARYPVTFYQNFQPEFPKPYQERAKKWGIL
jgi:uncharacterized protein (DUF169 family)